MGLFNDTITIFNKRMDKETAVWDKTVVNGVQW